MVNCQGTVFCFVGLDVCFVGVPFDQGTSNRPGARYGPRQVRQESHLVRGFNKETGEKRSEQFVLYYYCIVLYLYIYM